MVEKIKSKQEEIRKGMVELCEAHGIGWNEATYLVDYLSVYLDSVGCVLEVEGKMPEKHKDIFCSCLECAIVKVSKYGYKATVPLIDAVKLPQVVGHGGEANDEPLIKES